MRVTWSTVTRDRAFYATLTASTLSVAWLFWPFLDVLVYGSVVAAVAWPLHERLTTLLGGRRLLAAVLTALAFAVAVILPLTLLVYRFSLEAVQIAAVTLDWVADGGLEEAANQVSEVVSGSVGDALSAVMPEGVDPTVALYEPLRNAATSGLSTVSGWVPSLAGGLATGILDLVLLVFTVITLLAQGPRLMSFVFRMSPLDDRYEQKLLDVFQEFAVNMMVGVFAVALAQGLVATLGYLALGVPRAVFFGVWTALCSFVPIIGTAIVAVPLSLYVGWLYGWPWGLALALYAIVAIAGVDNLVRPMVIRGSTQIHPLLIFLSVFGGLSWMGLAGALVGPVLVAFFLALTRIHVEDFAGAIAEE